MEDKEYKYVSPFEILSELKNTENSIVNLLHVIGVIDLVCSIIGAVAVLLMSDADGEFGIGFLFALGIVFSGIVAYTFFKAIAEIITLLQSSNEKQQYILWHIKRSSMTENTGNVFSKEIQKNIEDNLPEL